MPSVTIDTTVDIDASRDAVWHVLTDFPRYDEWSPSLRIAGTPEVGAKLVVHANPPGRRGMTFKPKVLAATPGEELRRLGKLGIHGIAAGEHFFRPDEHRRRDDPSAPRRTVLRSSGRPSKGRLGKRYGRI